MNEEVWEAKMFCACICIYAWDLDLAKEGTEAQGDSGHTRISGNSYNQKEVKPSTRWSNLARCYSVISWGHMVLIKLKNCK